MTPIDSTNSESAYYQWNVDTNNDLTADFYVKLANETSLTGDLNADSVLGMYLGVYQSDWTLLGYGDAAMNSIVEAEFPISYVSGLYDEPTDVYMKIENQGDPNDDRLPDELWTHRIPEPTSMFLLGVGLIGLAGSKVRKRFKA